MNKLLTLATNKSIVLGLIMAVAVTVLAVASPQTFADGGAVGGGGNAGGGGGGGAHTKYGYGWYRFSVSSIGPAGISGGGSWASAKNQCKSSGNDYVIAFLINTSRETPTSAYVYQFGPGFGGYPKYMGNAGGGWMRHETAEGLYNKLPASIRAGYTWHVNVAWFCYNSNPGDFNMTASTGISTSLGSGYRGSNITVPPGTKVYWRHNIKNTGSITGSANGRVINSRPGEGTTTKSYVGLSIGAGATISKDESFTIPSTAADGAGYCQKYEVDKTSSKNSSHVFSSYVCAQVKRGAPPPPPPPPPPPGCTDDCDPPPPPPIFHLFPSVSSSPSLIREGEGGIYVLASVNNSGPDTSTPVSWQVTRFVVPPSVTLSRGGGSPCSAFSGYSSCTSFAGGSSQFGVGNSIVSNSTDPVSDQPEPGSQICFVTSVSPQGSDNGSWGHSSPSCTTVERVPFTQVLGNDLRVGSAFSTGTNVNSIVRSRVFHNAATWGEYGIMAPGSVINMASGSGANGGNSATQLAWSKLTFANTGTCSPGFGCWAGASGVGKIPNVRSFVTKAKHNGTNLNFDLGSASLNTSNIPSIIGGADLSKFNKSVSITTTGNIVINSDIIYTDNALSRADQIPQLILIGNNITIQSNVHRVDAWLIATNQVNTCGDVTSASQLRSTNCTDQLEMNGPVMAGRLFLARTYYDKNSPEKPAETLNLRADAYVWSEEMAEQNGQWQTVYLNDLPPRY